MSSKLQLKKILQCLIELKKCSKHKNDCVLKHLNDEALDILINTVFNIVNTPSTKLKKSQVNSLKPHKKLLLYLANPKNSLEKKRKNITHQAGSGFLTLISTIAIPLISALLSK